MYFEQERDDFFSYTISAESAYYRNTFYLNFINIFFIVFCIFDLTLEDRSRMKACSLTGSKYKNRPDPKL